MRYSADQLFIVTRFPNHWCASSCATTYAALDMTRLLEVAGSNRILVGLYVITPQFSMAPDTNSGTTTWSLLGMG